MLQRLLAFLTRHWPVIVVLLLVTSLIATNIQRESFLMGWDTFTVSLDLNQNFVRTFFATWRSDRGFGVASDSEVTDVFRQIIQGISRFILPVQLLEPVYYFLLLGAGMLGMFVLLQYCLSNFGQNTKRWLIQLSSLIGTIYYLTNLHTFETFFFPMVIYVTRWGLLPWVIYIFLDLLRQKRFESKKILLFSVICLLMSGSYLTATVFFTLLIFLGVISKFYLDRFPRVLVVFTLFFMLNAFWLLPFSNYFLQKAELIPNASTFVEVNEALLNKPDQELEWLDIFTLYSGSLEPSSLPFRDLVTNERHQVHQTLAIRDWKDLRDDWMLLVPLLVVSIGVFSIISSKKRWRFGWIPLISLMMVFLLRKYLFPGGALYYMVESAIPLFAIVFRFGSAKFSPLLLVTFALLVGVGIFTLLQILDKVKSRWQVGVSPFAISVLSFSIIGILIIPFRSYWQGELFSSLVEVQMPSAYESMAQYLNEQPDTGRVWFTPFDQFSYWRSHSWGYIGSSFFHFMVSRPVVDRTFEPASLELDYWLSASRQIVQGFGQARPEEKARRTRALYSLLSMTETRYVIFDQSIQPTITIRNLHGWGVFSSDDFAEILEEMVAADLLSVQQTYTVTDNQKLLLYQVKEVVPMVSSLNKVLSVDPELENTFIEPLIYSDSHYFQKSDVAYRTFPFWQPKRQIQYDAAFTHLKIPNSHQGTLSLTVPQAASESAKQAISVYLYLDKDELQVLLEPLVVPLLVEEPINTATLIHLPFQSDLTAEPQIDGQAWLGGQHFDFPLLANYRLSVGDQLLPVPATLSAQPLYVSTLLLSPGEQSVSLYTANTIRPSGAATQLTSDPNCFEDKGKEYRYEFTNAASGVDVVTTDGMTCLTIPLLDDSVPINSNQQYYFEITADFQTQLSFSSIEPSTLRSTYENKLRELAQNRQEYTGLQLCIIDPLTGKCLNQFENHQALTGRYTLPAFQPSQGTQAQLLIVLPSTPHSSASLEISNLEYRIFHQSSSQRAAINVPSQHQVLVQQSRQESLTFSWPTIHGPASLNNDAIGFSKYQETCYIDPAASSVWSEKGLIFSFVDDCYQGLSVDLPLPWQSMMLWSIDYSLLKGKQPRQIVSNMGENSNQFLSRYQGYPNLADHALLNTPFSPLAKLVSDKRAVVDAIQHLQFNHSSVLITDTDTSTSSAIGRYEVNQYAEVPALLAIRSFVIQELPASWKNITVDTGVVDHTYDVAEVSNVREILPSLWQAEIKTTTANNGQTLIRFGQAFDSQWQLFQVSRFWQLLWAKPIPGAEQVKVDGWANGWIVPSSVLDGTRSVYFLYVPERIAVLGWGITFISVLLVGGVMLKRYFLLKTNESSAKEKKISIPVNA